MGIDERAISVYPIVFFCQESTGSTKSPKTLVQGTVDHRRRGKCGRETVVPQTKPQHEISLTEHPVSRYFIITLTVASATLERTFSEAGLCEHLSIYALSQFDYRQTVHC